MFIESYICAGHFSRYWECRSEQNTVPLPVELYFLEKEADREETNKNATSGSVGDHL